MERDGTGQNAEVRRTQRSERIRRVLSERALLRQPSTERVTISYQGAEIPIGLGIAARVRRQMEAEESERDKRP